jgi:hypothetical protein
MKNTTKEISLNVCINLKVRVNNDSTDLQKEIDAKVRVIQWVSEELVIGPGDELDISHGYGEVEVFDLESINVELL